MNFDNLLELIDRELELYRALLKAQRQRIDLYLGGELDLVKNSLEKDTTILRQLREVQAAFKAGLNGRSLTEWIAEADEAVQLSSRRKIEELHRLVREFSPVNLSNFRFVQHGAWFSRAMLGEIFSGHAHYNQKGYLQAGNSVLEF